MKNKIQKDKFHGNVNIRRNNNRTFGQLASSKRVYARGYQFKY